METIAASTGGGGQSLSELSSLGFLVTDHLLEGEVVFPASPAPTLWGYLAPVVSEVTIAGRRHPRRVYHTGDRRLVCPGVDMSRATDEKAIIRSVAIAPSKFTEALGDAASDMETAFGGLQRYPFRSDLLSSVIASLHRASSEKCPIGKLYTDSLLNMAVMELWRLSGNSFDQLNGGADRLCSSVLRKIDRFIDDNSVSKIDAPALANVAGMPSALFQRAFKETTGRTPYQHILGRRLANAKCMIETSPLSLAEIAYRNGFSSQSHMNDAFKSKLGITPGSLRRAVS